jgi:ComF family protein
MKPISNILEDALQLFYPHVCAGCGDDLHGKIQLICFNCMQQLPHTDFAKIPDNQIEHIFYGRAKIQSACSIFYFSKGQIIQQLIHQLKYKGNQEIGIYLGKLMGEQLLNSGRFNHIDAIIPLPMHPDKQRKRGYNQAEILAKGISQKINVPLLNDIVVRSKTTTTQTNKQRVERWTNVDGTFIIQKQSSIIGKNILLVDDVITTGATLEACTNAILSIENTSVSIAVLAHASD